MLKIQVEEPVIIQRHELRAEHHIYISVGGLSRARLYRRLETPPTSLSKAKWRTFSVKLVFFDRIL